MKKLGKKAVLPLLFWVVTGIVGAGAGGYFLSQANKTATTIGMNWLGIPILGWVVIILILLIVFRSRR